MINLGQEDCRSEKCFFCEEEINSFPCINWIGPTVSAKGEKPGIGIYLHKDCAKEFAMHLGKDALGCGYAEQLLKKGFPCEMCWEIAPLEEHSLVKGYNVCTKCVGVAGDFNEKPRTVTTAADLDELLNIE